MFVNDLPALEFALQNEDGGSDVKMEVGAGGDADNTVKNGDSDPASEEDVKDEPAPMEEDKPTDAAGSKEDNENDEKEEEEEEEGEDETEEDEDKEPPGIAVARFCTQLCCVFHLKYLIIALVSLLFLIPAC